MAKAMMKATNAWGLGIGGQESLLQLVKVKQSVEMVGVFTQYMQGHKIYCKTFDILKPSGFLALVNKSM